MKQTFISNLILIVGLNLLVKPLYLLVVESEIQNRVGAEEFGKYFALINFSFILNILLDLGTSNWNTRKIAQNEFVAQNQFAGMIALRLFLALIYLFIAFIVGWMLDYGKNELLMLGVLAFNQVLVSMILYFRSYLTGMHLFRHDSFISVLDRLLLLLFMATLLWGHIFPDNRFRIEWLIYGQTISYAITLLVAFIPVYTQGKRSFKKDDSFSMRNALNESFPFALLILLSMLGYRIDAILLERMSGPREAGIYAMGFRFFEAVNMIAYLFAVLLLPIFTRMLKKNEDVTPLLQLGFKVLFTGASVVAFTACFFGETILTSIYDQNVSEAVPVFAWLMMSALFFSLQYLTGTLITASGHMKHMIVIAGIGMIYNIILNLFYIPQFGAVGAARASCFTQFIIFMAQAWYVVKHYHTTSIIPLATRTFLFASLTLCAGFVVMHYFSNRLPGFSSILVFLLLAGILAFATGMLQHRRILELIKTGGRTS